MSRPQAKNALPRSAVEIRLAVSSDAGEISRVLFESFSTFREDYTPEAFEVVTPSPDAILSRFDEGPMWVAVVDGKIAGTASVLPEPEWLYIRSLGVVPEARGLGIANKMMAAIEEYAVGAGFDKLFLYTTYFSTGAIELYEKHGFTRGRDTTAEEWYGTPGLAMEKSLRPFSIREVKVEDAEQLSDVAKRAYLQHFQHLWEDNGAAYSQRSFNVAELTAQLKDAGNRYSMAFVGTEPVGFLKVRPDNSLPIFNGANAYEIERIYLVREAKGKKIGKAMVRLAVDQAREMGKDLVWLKVMDSNQQTIGFYESCGFAITAPETLDLPLLKPELAGMFVMKIELRDQQ
ncbi:MAG: GNAT family N-acetyltransferase [Pyrinomonadaceae bacterium]